MFDSNAYPLQHTLRFIHQFIIPKPQHRIPLIAQPCIAFVVVLHILRMLPAIQLYDQFFFP